MNSIENGRPASTGNLATLLLVKRYWWLQFLAVAAVSLAGLIALGTRS
jgi:hypothetical protein